MQEEAQQTYSAIAQTDLCFYSLDKVNFFTIKQSYLEQNNFKFALFNSVEKKYIDNLELAPRTKILVK